MPSPTSTRYALMSALSLSSARVTEFGFVTGEFYGGLIVDEVPELGEVGVPRRARALRAVINFSVGGKFQDLRVGKAVGVRALDDEFGGGVESLRAPLAMEAGEVMPSARLRLAISPESSCARAATSRSWRRGDWASAVRGSDRAEESGDGEGADAVHAASEGKGHSSEGDCREGKNRIVLEVGNRAGLQAQRCCAYKYI